MSAAPARRLFFALWPDEAQRAALVHAAARIVRHCGGRPVPEENLHVTLIFLGSVPEPRLPELSALARRTAAAFPLDAVPIAVSLETLEHWGKAQVLTVLECREQAPAATPGAATLARILSTATAAAGFSPDLKPFRVHVTVARKVARPPRSSAMRKVEWSFDDFALVESRTLEEGPVYSVVESYLLGGAEKMRT
ncbi:MAG TPA: RNA 2',3'-cyclic phosphodiesterase [Steroidobacteraceae bacterium]|nr:RNA 2',3'-cyclic phosphodiesterase [Steroidobacteraceae bacterium]